MVKKVNKIAYLDGIRGVAAFLVFIHHFLLAFYCSFYNFDMSTTHLGGLEVRYGQSVFSVFSSGNFCVNVFFVLSGLVLSRKYFQTHQFEVIVSGAQRRFLRLYIPVAATLVISFILLESHLYFNQQVSPITHSDWWLGTKWIIPNPLQKLLYCLTAGTMFMGDATFDTTLWTMSIELVGSMFVFAFLAFTHHTKNRLACLVLILIYCLLTKQVVLSAFVLGIGLNYVEQHIAKVNKSFAAIASVFLFLSGLVLGSYPTTGAFQGTLFAHVPAPVRQLSGWYHAAGSFFLVLSFVISPMLQRIISLWLFRFLGYISFSIYLLHPLIIGSFSCFVFLKVYGHFGYNQSVLIVFLLTTAVALFASWLMAKFIDDPGIRFSKYVYKRWVKKDIPEPQVEVEV